jgi:hypothetical protein
MEAQNEAMGAMDPHNGGVEAQNIDVEVCRAEVVDSHHFDEEQDPDPHQSEKSNPDQCGLARLADGRRGSRSQKKTRVQ